MNSNIKNKYFAEWICKKIGKKKPFMRQFQHWKTRDLLRWTLGENFPKAPALAQLIYDLHLYTGQEYTSLLAEAHSSLQKDYREYQFEKKTIRRKPKKETGSD
jgi:hypothetical protein